VNYKNFYYTVALNTEIFSGCSGKILAVGKSPVMANRDFTLFAQAM
jgi:hypothetical protein